MSLVLVLCGALAVQAQSISRLDVEARGDWQYEALEGANELATSGFEGKFLNLRMDGSLAENLSYSIRYRAHKVQSSPFAATDWATLNYTLGDWELSAGKQVVAIGGYEYDRAPIDIYFASEYWHQIACYQFGVSAAYKFGGENNSKFLAQVCQSPYDLQNQNLYAYNLMWSSSRSDFASLYSVNIIEYQPNKFVGTIALGNLFKMGAVDVEFDIMSRTDLKDISPIDNLSAMLDVKWAVNSKLNLFTHASYDVNRSEVVFDPTVLPNTDIWRVGGGVEYFPMGKRNVRLHAASCYTFGNAAPTAALQNGQLMFQMGLTWRVNLL